MARALSIVAVALALVVLPAAYALDTSAATLGPPTGLKVHLEYVLSGKPTNPKPCNYSEPECLPQLTMAQNVADADSVVVTYELNMDNPNVTNDANTGVALRACYAKPSQKDRPWRNDKKVVNPSLSNQCKKLMNKDALPLGNGTFVWKLPNSLPAAIFSVRAYTICGKTDGNTKYCAWGQSPGYFQTTMWDTTPTWLVATTVPLICLGPVLLFLYSGGHIIKSRAKGGSA